MVCQITTDSKLAYLLSKSLFAFRNTNAFRCSGDEEARRLQTPPATENTRSDGADDTYEQELLVRQAKPTGTNDALGWFLSPG